MARKGQVSIDFNESFFEDVLRSSGVESLCRAKAAAALAVAKSTAPVDTGAYRGGLALGTANHAKRRSFLVVGRDPKTLLIESKTGNLARALKAVR